MLLSEKSFLPAILFLGVVLLVVLMFSCDSYIPYNKNDVYHEYSNYEGFLEEEGFEEGFEEGIQQDEEGFEEGLPEDEEDDKTRKKKPEVSDNVNKENFEGISDSTKLGYSPLSGNEIIDKFSNIPAAHGEPCVSASLTRGSKPLCLTPELIQSLTHRGNNT
jgi:hypothetical protein